MAYIFGLKQAMKMVSLLYSPLTATSIRVNKSSCTSLCWLMQTLFQQSNHDGVLNFYRIANKCLYLTLYLLHGPKTKISELLMNWGVLWYIDFADLSVNSPCIEGIQMCIKFLS